MKKIIVIVLLLVLAVAAVSLFKKRQSELPQAPVAAVLPVVVESALLSHGPVTLTLPAMGLVASDLSTTLSTKISGRVLKVFKQEGESVTKGERLATIDARDLTAKQEALRSKIEGLDLNIAVQRESHQRTLDLFKIGGASLEQSQKEEAALANLEKSKESLAQSIKEIEALTSYAVITAPVCGTLSKRLVQVGDLATPGKPLFRISSCSGKYLNLSLPTGLQSENILFNDIKLPLLAKNEASAAGLAQYIAPLPDGAGLVEGQFLNVRVAVYRGDDTLVPVDGLLSVGGESFVFVHDEGRTVKTRVEIVARGEEGLVVRPELAGKTILLAKPDILLRAAAGVPVLIQGRATVVPEAKGGRNNG